MMLSLGVEGGELIVVAHELGHSHKRLESLLSGILLATVGYMPFTVTHAVHHSAKVLFYLAHFMYSRTLCKISLATKVVAIMELREQTSSFQHNGNTYSHASM